MPNMQKFAYMPHIPAYAVAFFSIFLVQYSLRSVIYFWRQNMTSIYNLTFKKLKSKMSKQCTVGLLMLKN